MARHCVKLCRKWLVDYLSEHKPAGEHAVELACRDGCAVLTRDVDAVRRTRELRCDAPTLLFSKGRLWLAE
ncbi:MAG: hypothetical protein QXP31_10395 [Pyrobaculum sp.]